MITATQLLAIANSPAAIQNNISTIQEHLTDAANEGKTERYNEYIHPVNVPVLEGLGYVITKDAALNRYVISWAVTS